MSTAVVLSTGICLSLFVDVLPLKTCTTGNVACYQSIPPNPCAMGGIALVPNFGLLQKKQLQKRIKARVPVVLNGAGVVKSASHWSPLHLARTAKKMQKNDVCICIGLARRRQCGHLLTSNSLTAEFAILHIQQFVTRSNQTAPCVPKECICSL